MASHGDAVRFHTLDWEANRSHVAPQYPKLVRNIDANGLLTVVICYKIYGKLKAILRR